jgi:hypothetical protein
MIPLPKRLVPKSVIPKSVVPKSTTPKSAFLMGVIPKSTIPQSVIPSEARDPLFSGNSLRYFQAKQNRDRRNSNGGK